MTDSFYAATMAAKGIDSAECELNDVVKIRKCREIVASCAHIIAGVAELAKVEMKMPLVELLSEPPSPSLGQMLIGRYWGASPKFLVVRNRTPEFFRYAELRNSHVWSPGGTLGLQAIIVTACVEMKQTRDVSVILMLAPRVRYHDRGREGYVLVTLNAHGDATFSTRTHKIRQNSSVLYALGKITNEQLIEISWMSGGDPSDHLGFPGSYEYLVGNLVGLGEYLTDLSVLMVKK